MSALTDDTASEGKKNDFLTFEPQTYRKKLFFYLDQDPWDGDVVPPKMNGNVDEKKLNGKVKNETKIRGHNLNLLYKTRETPQETPSAPAEPQNGTLKQEELDIMGDISDKIEDAMNEKDEDVMLEKLMNVVNGEPTEMDIATDPETMDIKSPTNHINKTASDHSSTSIGSIEQRLADMTSPLKTVAEARAEKIEGTIRFFY